MKKMQYFQPQTKVVLIKTNTLMLGGSNTFDGTNNQIKFNTSSMDEGTGGDAASRRNVWDDEEEEEF